MAQTELELPGRQFRRPPARRLPRIPSASVSYLELQQEMSPVVHYTLASHTAAESDSLAPMTTAHGENEGGGSHKLCFEKIGEKRDIVIEG